MYRFPNGSLAEDEHLLQLLDRHLTSARKSKVAILWEADPVSYERSAIRCCIMRYASLRMFARSGNGTGDRATIYMGMVPELAIGNAGMRADKGLPTTSFWRFQCRSPGDRINDSQSKF
jgi:acyl-coenzyme A synthetase/AMP-(fatty) acid ligase